MENSNLYGIDLLTDKLKSNNSNINTNLFNDTKYDHDNDDIESIISSMESEKLIDSDRNSNNYSSDNENIDPEREQAIMMKKRNLLIKIKRYQDKNSINIGKPLSINTPLSELEFEWEIFTKEKNMDRTINQMKTGLMACIFGLETLNTKFDPFDYDLRGWTGLFTERLENPDTNDVLEELYDKYCDGTTISPEFELARIVVGSAINQHYNNKRTKLKMPDISGPSGKDIDDILKDDEKLNIRM